jgi:hypothetical protein
MAIVAHSFAGHAGRNIAWSMIPKSGNRFAGEIMLKRKIQTVIRFN